MKKVPQSFRPYFWEIDFATLDPEKDKAYIIKRLLESGDLNCAKWVYRIFAKSDIEKVLMKSRGLSPKTAAFWAAVLGTPETKVVCLQKPYRQRRKHHFPY